MKTQFSRRELYALGEPLGESVTRMEAGRRVYGGGGGIGGIAGNVFDTVERGVVRPAANTIPGAFAAPSVTPANPAGSAPQGDPIVQIPENNNRLLYPQPPTSTTPSVNPMSQIDQQQGIAGYAQPYVNTMLGAKIGRAHV